MKDFFVYRIALRLTLPLIVVICVLLGGTAPALAGKTAMVQFGFVGGPPTGNYQNVLLNVIAIRINPHANAAPNNGGWQKIPAPSGVAGGTNSELTIDLNSSQNIPQLFNTAAVRTGNYRIIQLLLDPSNPGTLIPNCPGPSADGCINYPIQLTNGNGITLAAAPGSPPAHHYDKWNADIVCHASDDDDRQVPCVARRRIHGNDHAGASFKSRRPVPSPER